jgi:hypothetical protein
MTQTNDLPKYDTPRDQLRKEGDYVLKEMKLVAYNGEEYEIGNLYAGLEIRESIFQNALFGKVHLFDGINLPQLFPLIGEERLKVTFSRQDLVNYEDEIHPYEQREVRDPLREIEVDFRILKMTERTNRNERDQTYALHFCTDELIKSLKTKEQKSFKNKLFSEIAATIFDDSIKVKKPLVVEDTDFKQDYVCANIPPFEVLNQLASRSVSGNGSAFLFYEDREQFNYVSLGKLVKQEPQKQKYLYHIANVLRHRGNEAAYRPRTIDLDIRSVEKFSYRKSFDVIRGLQNGLYASRLLTVDPIRQIWDVLDFELDKEFSSFKHLEEEKFFTDDSDALGSPKTFYRSVFTNLDHDKVEHIKEKEPGIKPHHKEEVILKRKSYFEQIYNNTIRIVVSGDPRRKVGQVIEFLLPNFLANVQEDPQELDKYVHGKYLILDIAHLLEVDSYYMVLDIVKDSYVTAIEHEDPWELYKDTY